VNPRWPIFIPSRGRAGIATAPRELDRMGVPYRLVVEEFEHDAYARAYGSSKILVLPQAYIDSFETGDPEGDELGLPKGSGPGRNFAWDTAAEQGHAWHWTVDDNIWYWARIDGNHCLRAGDGWLFAAMEDHASRYLNVGAAAPEYKMWVPVRQKWPRPFRYNRRVMSCILTRTEVPLRWRLRGNEDIDLTIRLLEAGWCTLNYLAFVQAKKGTQYTKGGYTDTLYAGGTDRKTMTLVRAHPQLVKPVVRFGRPHHDVNWDRWDGMHPVRDPAWTEPPVNPYAETKLVPRIAVGDPRAGAKARARNARNDARSRR
jgi:hypothetical protein